MSGISRFCSRRGNESDGLRMLKFSASLRRRLRTRQSSGPALFRRCRPVGALWLALLVAMIASAVSALADGGAVLLRETTGPFLVTVFTTPAAPQAGLVDVSVMVQSGDTGEALLYAEVDLQFVAPPGAETSGLEMFCTPNGTQLLVVANGEGGTSRVIPATRSRATNKLLYAATVNLPATGLWQMSVRVRRGSAEAQVNCALPVAASTASFATIWPFIAAPLLMIVVFVCHQRLKRRTLPSSWSDGHAISPAA